MKDLLGNQVNDYVDGQQDDDVNDDVGDDVDDQMKDSSWKKRFPKKRWRCRTPDKTK